MTTPSLHSTPHLRAVLREQVRAVGLSIRLPILLATALATVATLLVIAERITGGGSVDFAPELSMVPGALGFLLPIAVWKSEDRFGPGFLWTLPVDRTRHAFAKVTAGWVCLMAAIAVVVLWFLLLALFTGGNILGEQTFQLLPSAVIPAAGTLAPSALRTVHWTPKPLLWLVPFTAATGTYILSSAFALGTRYPLRWIIGVFFAALLASAIGAAGHIDWLRLGPAQVFAAVHEGPYGLDAVLSARAESLKTVATLSTGETVGVWRGLPDLGQWALASLLWIGLGLVALAAAVSRHRERRPRSAS
jgi:hypothetical protein